MTDREELFRLLYYALLEIRLSGHDTGNKLVYELADALHNVPAALAHAERSGTPADHAEILALTRQRLDAQGRTAFHEQAARYGGTA